MTDDYLKDAIWQAWATIASDLIECAGGEHNIHRDDLIDHIAVWIEYDHDVKVDDELAKRISSFIPEVFKTEYGPW